MPREENGPVPQQEEFGSGQPTLEDAFRAIREEWKEQMDNIKRYVMQRMFSTTRTTVLSRERSLTVLLSREKRCHFFLNISGLHYQHTLSSPYGMLILKCTRRSRVELKKWLVDGSLRCFGGFAGGN